MSKGDHVRPMDKKKYDLNYDRVFGEKPLNVWKPEDQEDPSMLDRRCAEPEETTDG